jgi:hypothetical protein
MGDTNAKYEVSIQPRRWNDAEFFDILNTALHQHNQNQIPYPDIYQL